MGIELRLSNNKNYTRLVEFITQLYTAWQLVLAPDRVILDEKDIQNMFCYILNNRSTASSSVRPFPPPMTTLWLGLPPGWSVSTGSVAPILPTV